MSSDNTKVMCHACNAIFDRINEENPTEYRCPKCQAAYRITAANKMHETGVFPGRDGYIYLAISSRYPEHLVMIKYREYLQRIG